MNKATKTNVAVLGTIFGISGLFHGFFEALQGNTPTDGLFINAIGEAQQMWSHGTEPAFTLIPNFLITGAAAMLVGLIIIPWSLFFVHQKNGPTVLLLLFLLLLLVGGGVAQIIFFPFIWLVSTRIQKPLSWWKKTLPGGFQKFLSRVWIWPLVLGAAALIFALEIAITGFVPFVNNQDTALSVMVFCLVFVILSLPLTFIAGFAYDIQQEPDQR
jgi:hypothetical protein